MNEHQKEKIETAALNLRVAERERIAAWEAKLKAADHFADVCEKLGILRSRFHAACGELVEVSEF